MIEKELTAIKFTDVQALVTNQTQEDRRLDYKEQLSVQTDDEKREFLADVSAFANTSGGHLVFGIREQRDSLGKPTGVPSDAPGLANFTNPDGEILRLEQLIRDGLAPRLSGVRMRAIPGLQQGPTLIIQVPQSWTAPHMVTLKNWSRFFGRGNAGKFQFDVSQIRAGFLFSDSLVEKIRNFRADRTIQILAKETPIPVKNGRTLIFHIIPLSAFHQEMALHVTQIREHLNQLQPLSSHGYSERVNLEGVVTFWKPAEELQSISYAQFYRNGIIELVDSSMILGDDDPSDPLRAAIFEDILIQGTARYLKFLRNVGVQGPTVVSVALDGMANVCLGVRARQDYRKMNDRRFDRNLLIFPEIVVEDLAGEPDVILRPLFDALYNAAGWDKCAHYDAQGHWQRPQ